jgi:hypothetical protein
MACVGTREMSTTQGAPETISANGLLVEDDTGETQRSTNHGEDRFSNETEPSLAVEIAGDDDRNVNAPRSIYKGIRLL